MTLSAERLTAARDDIAIVLEAFESEDASGVSPTANQLVAELVGLDEAGWNDLLKSLEGDELQKQMASLRQILKERVGGVGQQVIGAMTQHIRQVGCSVSFNISPAALIIDLHLTAGDETLAAKHNLEDALWVGAAVVQVVCEAMQSMRGTLTQAAQHTCIGSNFEGNLERAEAAIAEIRQIYEVVRNAVTPD